MDDMDDLFTPPNAGAYEMEERRKGPPLSYVGEKLRTSLYYIHGLCQMVGASPAEVPDPSAEEAPHLSANNEDMVRSADAAFYSALVAFLALYNAIGRLGEWDKQQKKIRALKALSPREFEEWLDSVEAEGSVTG